jgi:hypothetical protein
MNTRAVFILVVPGNRFTSNRYHLLRANSGKTCELCSGVWFVRGKGNPVPKGFETMKPEDVNTSLCLRALIDQMFRDEESHPSSCPGVSGPRAVRFCIDLSSAVDDCFLGEHVVNALKHASNVY